MLQFAPGFCTGAASLHVRFRQLSSKHRNPIMQGVSDFAMVESTSGLYTSCDRRYWPRLAAVWVGVADRPLSSAIRYTQVTSVPLTSRFLAIGGDRFTDCITPPSLSLTRLPQAVRFYPSKRRLESSASLTFFDFCLRDSLARGVG
jgi:hypothetical protein